MLFVCVFKSRGSHFRMFEIRILCVVKLTKSKNKTFHQNNNNNKAVARVNRDGYSYLVIGLIEKRLIHFISTTIFICIYNNYIYSLSSLIITWDFYFHDAMAELCIKTMMTISNFQNHVTFFLVLFLILILCSCMFLNDLCS